MLEKHGSDESSIGAGADDGRLESMTNAALLDGIDHMLEAPDAERNLNVDELIRHLEKLDERAPLSEDYVPGEVLSDLKDTHPELFGAGASQSELDINASAHPPVKKLRVRVFARAVGVAAAVMLVMAMTSTALGFNPIKAFLDWADGIVQVYSDPSGIMELPASDPSEYHSLAAALEANGIDPRYCPTWVPKDYAVYHVNVRQIEDMVKYTASYESERGELLVRVTQFDDLLWSSTAEREGGRETYVRNGVTYYLVSNHDQSKAGWQIEGYSYVIDGQISENELKKIIDSIS